MKEPPIKHRLRFSMFTLTVLMSVIGSGPAWLWLSISPTFLILVFLLMLGAITFIGLRDFGAGVDADPPNFS